MKKPPEGAATHFSWLSGNSAQRFYLIFSGEFGTPATTSHFVRCSNELLAAALATRSTAAANREPGAT
jgi:hypothetical protein